LILAIGMEWGGVPDWAAADRVHSLPLGADLDGGTHSSCAKYQPER